MEIKKIKHKVMFREFVIFYSYETWKGYYRENKIKVLAINELHAKEIFKTWSKDQRATLNAKILSVEISDKEMIEYQL
ncbi:MAG: hypothetical protein ACRCX8_19660 [Sarcina sp.]